MFILPTLLADSKDPIQKRDRVSVLSEELHKAHAPSILHFIKASINKTNEDQNFTENCNIPVNNKSQSMIFPSHFVTLVVLAHLQN